MADRGDIESADSLLSTIVPTIFRPAVDSSRAGLIILRHAYTRYELGDHASASNLYYISRSLLPALADTMRVKALRYHATVLLHLDDYDGALRALDLAEDLARRRGLTAHLRAIYRSKSNITSYLEGRLFKGIQHRLPAGKWSVLAAYLGALVFLFRRLHLRSNRRSREPVSGAP